MVKKGGAPLDNKNGLKLKPADVRQDAYADYCAYLATGKAKRGWVYDKDGYTCTWETMEKYIKDTLEFDPLKKKAAEAQGFKKWEAVVEDSAEGKNTKANTATLQMLMRNKYGWDRRNENTSTEVAGTLDNFCESWQKARKERESKD